MFIIYIIPYLKSVFNTILFILNSVTIFIFQNYFRMPIFLHSCFQEPSSSTNLANNSSSLNEIFLSTAKKLALSTFRLDNVSSFCKNGKSSSKLPELSVLKNLDSNPPPLFDDGAERLEIAINFQKIGS